MTIRTELAISSLTEPEADRWAVVGSELFRAILLEAVAQRLGQKGLDRSVANDAVDAVLGSLAHLTGLAQSTAAISRKSAPVTRAKTSAPATVERTAAKPSAKPPTKKATTKATAGAGKKAAAKTGKTVPAKTASKKSAANTAKASAKKVATKSTSKKATAKKAAPKKIVQK
ncbi:hypothetical protein ABZ924_31690 [Streptomyces sp. NPDC046876]|uniref:hypothetical protein n=1 Tax=Streptomyces sp. NPDC046876 TaxID=3155616 RepID=UPI00340F88DF